MSLVISCMPWPFSVHKARQHRHGNADQVERVARRVGRVVAFIDAAQFLQVVQIKAGFHLVEINGRLQSDATLMPGCLRNRAAVAGPSIVAELFCQTRQMCWTYPATPNLKSRNRPTSRNRRRNWTELDVVDRTSAGGTRAADEAAKRSGSGLGQSLLAACLSREGQGHAIGGVGLIALRERSPGEWRKRLLQLCSHLILKLFAMLGQPR